MGATNSDLSPSAMPIEEFCKSHGLNPADLSLLKIELKNADDLLNLSKEEVASKITSLAQAKTIDAVLGKAFAGVKRTYDWDLASSVDEQCKKVKESVVESSQETHVTEIMEIPSDERRKSDSAANSTSHDAVSEEVAAMPDGTPAETPADAPVDTPADTSVDTPADVPADTPTNATASFSGPAAATTPSPQPAVPSQAAPPPSASSTATPPSMASGLPKESVKVDRKPRSDEAFQMNLTMNYFAWKATSFMNYLTVSDDGKPRNLPIGEFCRKYKLNHHDISSLRLNVSCSNDLLALDKKDVVSRLKGRAQAIALDAVFRKAYKRVNWQYNWDLVSYIDIPLKEKRAYEASLYREMELRPVARHSAMFAEVLPDHLRDHPAPAPPPIKPASRWRSPPVPTAEMPYIVELQKLHDAIVSDEAPQPVHKTSRGAFCFEDQSSFIVKSTTVPVNPLPSPSMRDSPRTANADAKVAYSNFDSRPTSTMSAGGAAAAAKEVVRSYSDASRRPRLDESRNRHAAPLVSSDPRELLSHNDECGKQSTDALNRLNQAARAKTPTTAEAIRRPQSRGDSSWDRPMASAPSREFSIDRSQSGRDRDVGYEWVDSSPPAPFVPSTAALSAEIIAARYAQRQDIPPSGNLPRGAANTSNHRYSVLAAVSTEIPPPSYYKRMAGNPPMVRDVPTESMASATADIPSAGRDASTTQTASTVAAPSPMVRDVPVRDVVSYTTPPSSATRTEFAGHVASSTSSSGLMSSSAMGAIGGMSIPSKGTTRSVYGECDDDTKKLISAWASTGRTASTPTAPAPSSVARDVSAGRTGYTTTAPSPAVARDVSARDMGFNTAALSPAVARDVSAGRMTANTTTTFPATVNISRADANAAVFSHRYNSNTSITPTIVAPCQATGSRSLAAAAVEKRAAQSEPHIDYSRISMAESDPSPEPVLLISPEVESWIAREKLPVQLLTSLPANEIYTLVQVKAMSAEVLERIISDLKPLPKKKVQQTVQALREGLSWQQFHRAKSPTATRSSPTYYYGSRPTTSPVAAAPRFPSPSTTQRVPVQSTGVARDPSVARAGVVPKSCSEEDDPVDWTYYEENHALQEEEATWSYSQLTRAKQQELSMLSFLAEVQTCPDRLYNEHVLRELQKKCGDGYVGKSSSFINTKLAGLSDLMARHINRLQRLNSLQQKMEGNDEKEGKGGSNEDVDFEYAQTVSHSEDRRVSFGGGVTRVSIERCESRSGEMPYKVVYAPQVAMGQVEADMAHQQGDEINTEQQRFKEERVQRQAKGDYRAKVNGHCWVCCACRSVNDLSKGSCRLCRMPRPTESFKPEQRLDEFKGTDDEKWKRDADTSPSDNESTCCTDVVASSKRESSSAGRKSPGKRFRPDEEKSTPAAGIPKASESRSRNPSNSSGKSRMSDTMAIFTNYMRGDRKAARSETSSPCSKCGCLDPSSCHCRRAVPFDASDMMGSSGIRYPY